MTGLLKKIFHPSDWLFMKNITPNQLALISAALGAFFTAVIVSFLYLIFNRFFNDLYLGILFTIINFGVLYLVFLLALERFIYRKIKLIYKTISRLKKAPHEVSDTIDMNENMIDEVEVEVKQWAKESKEEIEDLKKMEVYRREFMGNVSHELKTPIYNIQGYLDTLLNGGLEDENINLDYLKKALQNADRLNAIVDDLNAISQYESGELVLHKKSFKIYGLAKAIMQDMEMMAGDNDITLRFKDGLDTGIRVYADSERIEQVLTNLLTNSIKYGKEKGTTWIGIYVMDDHVLVEVTDNGIGIEEKHLSRLFERFYRVDYSRSRLQGGSGLGLAIAKHIIEAHQHTIHVRSKPGLGTTFGFTLDKAK